MAIDEFVIVVDSKTIGASPSVFCTKFHMRESRDVPFVTINVISLLLKYTTCTIDKNKIFFIQVMC